MMAGPISFNAIPSQPSLPAEKKQEQGTKKRPKAAQRHGDEQVATELNGQDDDTESQRSADDEATKDDYLGTNLDVEA